MERKPKVLRELRVYAREKAPFEAEFPLVRENLIEDKFISTLPREKDPFEAEFPLVRENLIEDKFNPENIDQDDPDQDDPEPTSRAVCNPKKNHVCIRTGKGPI